MIDFGLTIKQPWVHCIEIGKPVENRTWFPPKNLIGKRIAIHASKSFDLGGMSSASRLANLDFYMMRSRGELPTGAIVGTFKLAGYVSDEGTHILDNKTYIGDAEEVDHFLTSKWYFGPVGFVIEEYRKLKSPIPVNGALGFWGLPHSVKEVLQFNHNYL